MRQSGPFFRWCETSQVDFRSPSIKQVADFLLHLFQEKHLQPSTIDGYRSAKDISPATISSWIKQTVILCYELSDQEPGVALLSARLESICLYKEFHLVLSKVY